MTTSTAQRPEKRSVSLYGHRTSVTLEPAFWNVLARMAASQERSMNALVAQIDAARPADVTLAGALRVAALAWALGEGPVKASDAPPV